MLENGIIMLNIQLLLQLNSVIFIHVLDTVQYHVSGKTLHELNI